MRPWRRTGSTGLIEAWQYQLVINFSSMLAPGGAARQGCEIHCRAACAVQGQRSCCTCGAGGYDIIYEQDSSAGHHPWICAEASAHIADSSAGRQGCLRMS